MVTLYDNHLSGNGYKVRLMLTLLGVPFEIVWIDTLRGESHTDSFLAINPNGRIPALVDGAFVLPESNAILHYLADGTEYLPEGREIRVRILQWMFFEQYSHEPNIAVLRHWFAHLDRPDEGDEVARKRGAGYDALRVMEQHLAAQPYFAGDRYTIADISLYAYTHVADEGGFDLSPYPATRDWLGRIAAQLGHINIDDDCGFSTPESR